jgi:hypothetical protein
VKVGDLVKYKFSHDNGTGIITHIDPEEIGDTDEVLVVWSDGEIMNHSVEFLEVLSESR